MERDLELIQYLIRANCDVNKAARCVDFDGTKSKVRIRKYNDKLEWSCLYRAICMKDEEVVRQLVTGGADVNVYDRSCCSALWHAVDSNQAAITEILLSSPGCQVNAQDSFKMAPLHVAATHRSTEISGMLIDHGAEVDICQLQGATPLYLACAGNETEPVKLLLRHGANPNHQDKDGFAPLYAVLDKSCNPELIYLLVAAGAFLYKQRMFYSLKDLRLLALHKSLYIFMKEYLFKPKDLKSLCALNIKMAIKSKNCGRSIYKDLAELPLPGAIVDYLQLNNL